MLLIAIFPLLFAIPPLFPAPLNPLPNCTRRNPEKRLFVKFQLSANIPFSTPPPSDPSEPKTSKNDAKTQITNTMQTNIYVTTYKTTPKTYPLLLLSYSSPTPLFILGFFFKT